MSRTILVTGSAGFIGFHLCQRLLADGFDVIGFDAMTDYYDVSLKHKRHALLEASDRFTPVIERLETPGVMEQLLAAHKPGMIVHLAAQAGVRYSIDAPRSYVQSNISGTFELLEAARHHTPKHLLIASTSSVYGSNTEMPYCETHKVDTQMSFYAATKKATEAMAQTYAHLYSIPITMFRFFTVYGPWGRPDMALFKFTDAILNDRAIDVYNHGDMLRDFTYVTDLVDGVRRLMDAIPSDTPVSTADSLSPIAPWRAVNIGNGAPTKLSDFIIALEGVLGKTAQKNMLNIQPGDMPSTWADTTLLSDLIGPLNKTELKDGVANFVEWYNAEYV
ncbi:SDR family NAD(P)-dependent oxidoreductase [Planktotalea arctica]|uniref:SDR family NAD(P)-dependent oxidoreductase n=1 Tax=Planktotalea arctica TaxID=1481893 RepID=UPI000A1782A6|nr:SDR family NAD(P)-dependent oxidoreductase [Planktotalea arctica]